MNRTPSHEELVDLSWLLDSALVAGNRAGAIDFAARLQDSLHHHQAKTSGAGLGLRAELAALLTRLRRGDIPRRTAFRHRVQRLIDEGRERVLPDGAHDPAGDPGRSA